MKNKTILKNVHQVTNNFRKSSVEEQIISQIVRLFYNKHVKMLKKIIFIMARRRIFDTLNIVTIENMGPKISNHVNLTLFKKKTTHTIRCLTLRGRKTDTLGSTDRQIFDTIQSKIRHFRVRYSTLYGVGYSTPNVSDIRRHYKTFMIILFNDCCPTHPYEMSDDVRF